MLVLVDAAFNIACRLWCKKSRDGGHTVPFFVFPSFKIKLYTMKVGRTSGSLDERRGFKSCQR